jgi:hypothetical protein
VSENGERLDGWKAISAYVQLSVRQCQRLAKTSGLPVQHRGPTRAVCAFTDELDQWVEAGGRSGKPEGHEADVVQSGASGVFSDSQRGVRRRWAVLALAGVVVTAVALGWGWHRSERLERSVLLGSWSYQLSGVTGRSDSIGRLDTRRFVGPGSSVTVRLEPLTGRWSGGVEILQDRLHRTQVALTPEDGFVQLLRMPSGVVTTLPLGPGQKNRRPVLLQMTVLDDALELRVDEWQRTVHLEPWDVTVGKLVLSVGREGNEYVPSVPGACTFRRLEVDHPLTSEGSWRAAPVPESRRTSSNVRLTVNNVDDQIDVLVDGARVVTAGFRERILGFELSPFLTPGEHVLTARVFNRKWTTTYGVRLVRDGQVLLDERCGQVNVGGAECAELGNQRGMVRSFQHTFSVD